MEPLSISQAAKKLGVHPNRLRAWEKQSLNIGFRKLIAEVEHYEKAEKEKTGQSW